MKIEPCPICGHSAIIKHHVSNNGRSRGYVYIYCSNDNCPMTREVPVFTFYDEYWENDKKQYSALINRWNKEALKINELIKQKNEVNNDI